MIIGLEFTLPLYVSSGDTMDQLYITINNETYFRAKSDGLSPE